MTFDWPLRPAPRPRRAAACSGVYLWTLRRRRKQAVSYSSVALLRSVLPRRSRWRRHVPVPLLLASLGVLGIAAARPQMVRERAHRRARRSSSPSTSPGRCAPPTSTRTGIAAAQQAARDFVEDQPAGHPHRPRRLLRLRPARRAADDRPRGAGRAIDGLTTGRGTAIGAAMLKSLDAIAEVNPDVRAGR